jgi:hypothetical protein
MVEKGASNSAGIVHPLIKKVLASKPPIAELIGVGTATRESDGHSSWRRAVRFGRCSHGHGVRVHIGA